MKALFAYIGAICVLVGVTVFVLLTMNITLFFPASETGEPQYIYPILITIFGMVLTYITGGYSWVSSRNKGDSENE